MHLFGAPLDEWLVIFRWENVTPGSYVHTYSSHGIRTPPYRSHEYQVSENRIPHPFVDLVTIRSIVPRRTIQQIDRRYIGCYNLRQRGCVVYHRSAAPNPTPDELMSGPSTSIPAATAPQSGHAIRPGVLDLSVTENGPRHFPSRLPRYRRGLHRHRYTKHHEYRMATRLDSSHRHKTQLGSSPYCSTDETLNPTPDEFTSGPKTSIPIRRHSTRYAPRRSGSVLTLDNCAAMNSAGW